MLQVRFELADTEVNLKRRRMSWALCVATLGRRDVLCECVRLAVSQTRTPLEIAICDASEDWEVSREAVSRIVPRGIVLHYLPAERRSSAVQRNQCIDAVSSDILFLIDDDSFMYPDFAQRILEVYEADEACRVAAVAGVQNPVPPGRAANLDPESKRTPRPSPAAAPGGISSFRWFGWLEDHVLMRSGEWAFLPYSDGHERSHDDSSVPARLPRRQVIAGFLLTARRSVADEFRFDPDLLAYCPVEDGVATYRYSRRGLLVAEPEAFLHHFDAAAGRLKRRKVAELQVTNMALFLRKHSIAPYRDVPRFALRMVRRLIAAVLKDALTRDFSFPRSRGVTAGLAKSARILTHDRATVGPWYQGLQRRILQ